MIRTELIRRLAEVLREPFYEAQIVSDRPSGIVTTFEFFEHHLAKAGHSGLPPVSHTLNRPQNYSSANNAATAAPAASFSPPMRKLLLRRQSSTTTGLDNSLHPSVAAG